MLVHYLLFPFWNARQRRLRALWRILLQIVMLVSLLGLLGFLATLSDGAATHFLQFTSLLVAIGTVISFLLAAKLLDRRPFREFGFRFTRRWWLDFGFGLALGALLMSGIFGVESLAGWVTITSYFPSEDGSFWPAMGMYLLLFVSVGIQEEMLSRGYWLRNLAEGFNVRPLGARGALWLAYLFSSAIFGLLHLDNPNSTWISTLNLILAGLFLGLPFILTGELAMSIGLHISWNFFQGNVFGFPVSGIATGTSFVSIQQGGPDLWTGGPFGPEAGLVGVGAIVAGMFLVVGWVYLLDRRLALRDDLAVYLSPSSSEIYEPQIGSASVR